MTDRQQKPSREALACTWESPKFAYRAFYGYFARVHLAAVLRPSATLPWQRPLKRWKLLINRASHRWSGGGGSRSRPAQAKSKAEGLRPHTSQPPEGLRHPRRRLRGSFERNVAQKQRQSSLFERHVVQ